MRIAQVIKAKRLREFDRVLVMNADGDPQWASVTSIVPEHGTGWLAVALEGRNTVEHVDGNSRITVWK